MNTKEPKLKKFVEKWNKHNAKIQAKEKVDQEKDEVLIKYSYEKKVIKSKEKKPKWKKKKNKKA